VKALLFLPVLAALLTAAERRSRRQAERLGLPTKVWRRVLPDLAALGALLLLLWPQAASPPATASAGGPAVAIAIDVSASMAATDAGGSRLERARAEIRELVAGLPGARFALIPFAGEAILQVPLTADREALLFFVDRLAPGMVDAPGSAPEEAARAAVRALDGAVGEQVVVLVSDGERTAPEPAPPPPAGVPVHVVPVGSEAGAPVPDALGQPRRDEPGRPLLTRLDLPALKRLAAATGGEVLIPTAAGPAVAPLLARWAPSAARSRPATGWLTGGAVLLLLLRQLPTPRRERCKGVLLALLPLLLFAACGGDGREGRSLFATAQKRTLEGRPDEAAHLFNEAAQKLGGEERAVALFNQGTVLLTAGKAVEALPALEEALLLLPGDAAVRANLVLALRAGGERRPPGAGEKKRQGGESATEGLSHEQALKMLESVRPDPDAPAAEQAVAHERTVARDW
jgi:Ca-activated chloride channel family protein